MTLGAEVSVVTGPVGRKASIATDAKLAEIVSYSRSRGLFAGVALDGAAIHSNAVSNAMFQKPARVEEKLVAGSNAAKIGVGLFMKPAK